MPRDVDVDGDASSARCLDVCWFRDSSSRGEAESVGTASQEIGFQQHRKFKKELEGNAVKSRKDFCK